MFGHICVVFTVPAQVVSSEVTDCRLGAYATAVQERPGAHSQPFSCFQLKSDLHACTTGSFQHAGSQANADQATKVLASVKGFLFYLSTFTLALPLFVTMLLLAPFVALFDKHRCVSDPTCNVAQTVLTLCPFTVLVPWHLFSTLGLVCIAHTPNTLVYPL